MLKRFRDIAAFVLQHATFSLPPPLVSPKFPHVPLGVGGSPDRLLATKSEGAGLIVCAISFQDFQITNVTDGQTDDMRSQDRANALKCIAR